MSSPGTPTTDERIIRLLQEEATRERGFRLLMGAYQERLYHHLRRLVNQHEDANDLLQNCLVKVYRNIDSFRGQSSLYTWLYRIASNEAFTFLKRRQRRATEELPAVLPTAGQFQADSWFDGDELERQLQYAVQQLPDRQRSVFCLRYFEELSYREIADILGTSVGSLKASYHHAVKKVERCIIEMTI